MPLVIRDPRLGPSDRGRTVDAMALNLDIPATILDLAGVDRPAAYQGRSVVPFTTGAEPADWRTDFFAEHLMEIGESIPKYEGVRGERMVYARYFEQAPAYEFLHDLERDPDQLENLVGDPAYRETLDHLRVRTDALRDGYGGAYDRDTFRARSAPAASARPNLLLIIGDDQFPGGGLDYVLSKPPLRFVVLDVKIEEPDAREAQRAWLREALAADRQTSTLVIWHYAPYNRGGLSSCGFRLHDWSTLGQEAVLDLVQEAPNVVATLNGHDHWDEVNDLRGIHHIQNAAFVE